VGKFQFGEIGLILRLFLNSSSNSGMSMEVGKKDGFSVGNLVLVFIRIALF
jgi:hypothetical protein